MVMVISTKEKIDDVIVRFRKLPVVAGVEDDFVLSRVRPEILVIRTLEDMWSGTLLGNISDICRELGLCFYVDRAKFEVVIH